jgi:DNA replication protein DnaC
MGAMDSTRAWCRRISSTAAIQRRGDRLLERRRKQARFRDPQKTFDNFDFTFNPKMNRSLIFDLATSSPNTLWRGRLGVKCCNACVYAPRIE